MEDGEEYRDGELEYSVIESLIEEIVDTYRLHAYVYISSDKFDNVLSTTLTGDSEPDSIHDLVQRNALACLINDFLNSGVAGDRNASIAEIYDIVYEAIHYDEDEEDEDNAEFE